VQSLRARREGGDVARAQLAISGRRAQGRGAGQDDDPFLVAVVQVVDALDTGIGVEDGRADPRAAGALAQVEETDRVAVDVPVLGVGARQPSPSQ
jgi:hypothetical protein